MANFFSPILLSLQVTAFASLFSISFGGLTGLFLARKSFPGKFFVEIIFLLPLVLPPTVVGFILLVIFGNNGFFQFLTRQSIIFTWHAATIASAVVAFPLMYQAAKAAFSQVEKNIEEAARVDGANEWKVFLHISLPVAFPTLLSGAILSIARALGEFGATLMIAGNIPGRTQTLPIAIYMAINTNNMNLAWIYVGVMVLISTCFLFIIQVLSRKT